MSEKRRISLSQQIEAVDLAINHQRQFAHRSSEMQYQMERLQVAQHTLLWVQKNEALIKEVKRWEVGQ